MLLLLFLLAGVTDTLAQNVTIRGNNGSTLAARKTGGQGVVTDVFYGWGGFATWKHEQLSLTMTTADSDKPGLDANGQITNPANNIFKNGEVLQLGCGMTVDNYIAISLPKGYRFRGYTIKFARDIARPAGRTSGTEGTVKGAEFGETNSDWSWHDNATHKTGINYQAKNATEYTITRMSSSSTDMGNMLYFKLTSPYSNYDESYRAFITLRSVELLFTAEADYTPVIPTTTASGASAVDIMFDTDKVDYGTLESKSYSSYSARMGYDSKNVKELTANLTLYEEESVTDATTTNDFDGTVGKMVNYVTTGHSIYSEGTYFKLGGVKNADNTDKEQIYFIETPNYVEVSDNTETHKNPIGYRIVGAEFEATKSAASSQFYITYTYNGTKYYFTTDNGSFKTNTQIAWTIDSEGRITNGSEYIYYHDGWAETTTIKDDAYKFEIVSDGIRLKDYPTFYLRFYIYIDEDYSGDVYYYGVIQPEAGEGNAKAENIQTTGTDGFTVNIYDKTGTSILKTITINNSNTYEKYSFKGFNNDAVKFGVVGQGLVRAKLTMQALDPYIDRLNIVCQEATKSGDKWVKASQGSRVAQRFTATDFSVKGGKFKFYVPEEFNFPCLFTFEDLYSQYGDETYYGDTNGNARYSLVMSPYWSSTTNVYQTDPNHTYIDKVWTETVGKVKYKFNNAADFSSNQSQGGLYKEYPFTPALYGDGIVSQPNNFGQFIFTQEEMNAGKEKTAFLFTCDETRYNIAPTTGIQHTAYAYYAMDITMVRQNYNPVLEWIPIYDKTCYQKNGALAEAAQWGLKLTTDPINEDDEENPYGYLQVDQIINAIDKAAVAGATNGPTSKDQILYIDGTLLQSIVENQKTTGEGEEAVTTGKSMGDLRTGLGANVLVFLPKGTTTNEDNFVYVTPTDDYRGANNFVLTDLNPFFTPYDIQVDEAKQIRYTRNVTVGKNGKVTSATIIMPFELSVDEKGQHTNVGDNLPTFSLHQMQATDCMRTPEAGALSYAFFPNINLEAGVSKAAANTPYLVNVLNPSSEKNISFVISQNGTTVKATGKKVDDDYRFVGETAKGTVKHDGENKTTDYSFTNYGSYSGKKIAKAETIFYFAHNTFLSSKELMNSDYVKIAPFRTYYETAVSSNAKLASFDIFFGEGEGNGTTGINTLNSNPDLKVVAGNGAITFTSTIDQNVRVNGVSGVLVENANLQAGETRTINVPAGMYIINGVKIIVK